MPSIDEAGADEGSKGSVGPRFPVSEIKEEAEGFEAESDHCAERVPLSPVLG